MRNVLCCLLVFLSITISAQFDHESVFSDLNDEALRAALVENYKTTVVLEYGDARDTFFRNIDAVDNVLECVYTGFKINLDPNLDPTEDAFDKGINTEHTYPRSKGATNGTNAFSDMHHLFPTRERVNADRGSLPFQDIVDSQTDKWYFEENITTSIPSQNIDDYSELLTSVGFEPREEHKGDVARAYFYFYTMYENQALQEDPDFFSSQQETMCQWHFEDPVDEKEWVRNEKIAVYQDGKKNPFILDCKLARLYCDDIIGSCLTVSATELATASILVRPNPAQEMIFLDGVGADAERYSISSIDGSMISKGWIEKDEKNATIMTNHLRSGFYVITIYNSSGNVSGITKFIKI